MKEIIFRKINQHLSLFVIAFGAISFFIANIILKEELSNKQFGEYSLVITYFTMVYIYGLFGLEQVFVKYSFIVKTKVLQVNVFLVYLLVAAILVSTMISSAFYLYYYGDIPINSILLVVATFCMISLLLLYSIFRLNSNFVLAQLIINGFKIFSFFLILLMLFFDSFNYQKILVGISLSIVASLILAVIYFRKKLRITFVNTIQRKTILAVGFYFLISTITFSAINFADRFIIDYRFGIEKFGDYFYLANIFLAPFSLLQNYIGFKNLVEYKNEFTVKKFKKNNLINLFIGIAISLLMFIFYKFIIMIDLVTFNFSDNLNVVLLLLILGTVKLYSAGIYPAFDIIINLKYLKISKISILFISFIVLGTMYYFAQSLEMIIAALILIWIVKTLMLKYFLLFQVKSNPSE